MGWSIVQLAVPIQGYIMGEGYRSKDKGVSSSVIHQEELRELATGKVNDERECHKNE